MITTKQIAVKYLAAKKPAEKRVLRELLEEGLPAMQRILYDHLLFNELSAYQLMDRCEGEHYSFSPESTYNLLICLIKIGLVERRRVPSDISGYKHYIYKRAPII